MRTPRLLCLAAAAGLMGCGGESEPPEHQPTQTLPRVAVGVGRPGQYVPVKPGDTLRLQRGCQGSQHVFVSLQAWNLDPLTATVTLALTRQSDGQRVSLPYQLRLPFEPANAQRPAMLSGLLLVVPEPSEALGERVTLEARLEDAGGRSSTDTREGIIQWGPDACP
ncbi:hypothetical protein [Corallococcus macrosporus]|uniref:Lipoprotein n=1 Tax=Corallococcus macrosporus DSM 14697 TaxID=1189310 RepID=A0A250JY17_9BACT|nr:hypothetical protein [Corallococcus macrosporus]ATB48530.1 hypothetical protein MYMAC_004157 [Corallococcus macrosporus DSM 14697]